MIEAMGFEKLTPKELADLPDRLSAMPPMVFKELQKRIKPLPAAYPFTIHPYLLFLIFIVVTVVIILIIVGVGCVLIRVRSRVTGFKPMVKLCMNNLPDNIENRLAISKLPKKLVAKDIPPPPPLPSRTTAAPSTSKLTPRDSTKSALEDAQDRRLRKFHKYLMTQTLEKIAK